MVNNLGISEEATKAEAKVAEEKKKKADELRWLLQAVVERYNDPYPKEHNGYGYVRDQAWSFLQATPDQTVIDLFGTPIRHNRWCAAAYRGWTVVNNGDKEGYQKTDGTSPTEEDWKEAFDLMVEAPLAYYWQYGRPHNK